MFFSKEMNSKGMSNIYYWKTDVLKTCRESKFPAKKNIWRNALALKSEKVQGIFGEKFILALLPSAVFHLQSLISFIKIDLRDIMNVNSNILAKN